MPTVNVIRDNLFKALKKNYGDKGFEDLCFEFGIELDEITSEKNMLRKEKGEGADLSEASEDIIYKIDVPANRYDLLCLEGLTQALQVFVGAEKIPPFKIKKAKTMQKLIVKPEVAQIRPFVVGAVLRNIKFTKESYNSFLDLQDKLHQNIARKRTLVAIGTHDLDSIEGPFTYEALAPEKIEFQPLFKDEKFTAKKLMEVYKTDNKLKHYLHIVENSPVYPVIKDKNGVVLSLPPIINGDHSKLSVDTKNVFIECTGTDLSKAHIVLNMLICAFSQYCDDKFTVEPVEVTLADGKKRVDPDLSTRTVHTDIEYLNRLIGVELKSSDITSLCAKMMLPASVGTMHKNKITVTVPPNRSDVIHACDVMEDVAIAYGFNNIKQRIPKTSTVGKQLPINKLSDLLRVELAMNGYTEILSLALCSTDENFKLLNRENNNTAVVITNPKTPEFQVCRTTLLPGMLKTVNHNKTMPVPLSLFEVSDVILKDDSKDVGARNERHVVALYTNSTGPGFEVIHGLVDQLMSRLRVSAADYCIEEGSDPTFFPGRCGNIMYKKQKIGTMGVLHPTVIKQFELSYPASALEFNLEPFL